MNLTDFREWATGIGGSLGVVAGLWLKNRKDKRDELQAAFDRMVSECERRSKELSDTDAMKERWRENAAALKEVNSKIKLENFLLTRNRKDTLEELIRAEAILPTDAATALEIIQSVIRELTKDIVLPEDD